MRALAIVALNRRDAGAMEGGMAERTGLTRHLTVTARLAVERIAREIRLEVGSDSS